MVERNLAKVDTRVRFPSLAPAKNKTPDDPGFSLFLWNIGGILRREITIILL